MRYLLLRDARIILRRCVIILALINWSYARARYYYKYSRQIDIYTKHDVRHVNKARPFLVRTFAERVVPKILGQLCSGNLSPTQHLETQQALVKQLAEILEFVLKFDEHKMKTPAIQNDFSYYRRTLTRASLTRQDNTEKDLVVGNELANRMSLFYAHATPMLRVLSHATITFLMDVSGIASLHCSRPRPPVVAETIIDPARY